MYRVYAIGLHGLLRQVVSSHNDLSTARAAMHRMVRTTDCSGIATVEVWELGEGTDPDILMDVQHPSEVTA